MAYQDKLKPLGTTTSSSYQSKLKPIAPPKAEKKPDLLQRAGNFLTRNNVPGAQIGKALGESVYSTGRALGQLFTGNSRGAMETVSGQAQRNNASMGRIVGDLVQSAALPASMAAAPVAGLGRQVLQSSATGATLFGAGAAAQGKDLKGVAKNAALGGAIGGALPLAGKAVSAASKQVFERLPKRIMQSVLGQSKMKVLGGKDVSEYALKQRRVGTPDKLISDSKTAIDELSGRIDNAITKVAPKTVRILKNEPISDVVKRINSQGGAITPKEVTEIVERLAPQAKGLLEKKSLSLTEANQLRSALDKTLGDRGFLTSQLPFNKEILRAYTNALREQVKTLAPSGTRQLFSELSKEITLRDALMGKFAVQNRNLPINAFDLILAGGGYAGGGPLGAVGSFAVKKAVQSTTGRTGAAVLLNEAQKLAPAVKQVGPAVRTSVLGGGAAISPFGETTTQSNDRQR